MRRQDFGRRDFLAGAAGLGLVGPGFGIGQLSALAQDASWPNQTVRMIVPFPPGGQGDLAARPIAKAFERILGKPVIVDNRGGAGGALGNAAVARGANDGHTLLMTLSSLAVLPEADRIMGRQAQYETADLIPIARVLADPTLLAVHADTPWKTVADLVEDARKRPGEIPYGSSGPYGTLHVSMEMFTGAAGIRLNHIPYRGAGPALNDLISGQIKALASAPGVLKPQVESGKIRVLANFGAERVASFPDTPTFQELGFKDVEFYIWGGLFVPRATPAEIVTRLRSAMRDAMADTETRRIFETAGSPPAYLDQPEFATFVTRDSTRLIEAVRKIGRVDGG
ncbi:MAG: Bug family tripartite tricarboxylate transporter substrate binding protein [Beijerinckiaceae bacterium]